MRARIDIKLIRGAGSICLAGFLCGAAAEAAPAPPNPACRAVERALDPVTTEAKRIDSLLARYAQYGFAGSILARQAGRPVLARGYGWANAEERLENAPSTLVDIASLAKTFTAAGRTRYIRFNGDRVEILSAAGTVLAAGGRSP